MTDAGFTLAQGMDFSGLSFSQLWFRYVALGGNGSVDDLRRLVAGHSVPGQDHNVVAQALNEYFLDRDEDHPVAYDLDPPHLRDRDLDG